MAYGLTVDGFFRKRLDEILEDLNESMRVIFGENLNLEPSSPDGQVNGVMSESFDDLWAIGQECYNAYNPAAAVGVALSNLVQLAGITRQDAVYSTANVDVTGDNGTYIPAGSLVSTDEGIQFSTDSDITIAAGIGSSDVTAVEPGPLAAAIGTIINIDTPITGWDTVTNDAAATEGYDQETDAELRARFYKSYEKAATSIYESIVAAVLALDGVEYVSLTENTTDATDLNGLDPHSFQVMVDGGVDAEIAQAIFENKPVGIGTNGTTSVSVTDSVGTSHTIKFQRPAEITIHVKVTLSPGNTYLGDDAVKQAIVDFANGDLIEGRGFGLGDDVVYSEMYIPVNDESLGIEEVTEILIDTVDPPTGTTTIDIDFDEKASFTTANIDIVQV